MPVCFCIGNSTLSRNISNGTLYISVGYIVARLRNSGCICRKGCGTLAVYAVWIAESRPYMPHRLRLPAVRHMDCRIPQTCIARREPHYSSTATALGTTFRIQYRSIQIKVNTVPHTTTQELLKKSPRGVQRGRGFTAPLRFSTASQSKKTRPSAKQESKNKTKNQPHNKQRKRKSQRKIKKKNKRKNKGEKA